MTMQQKQARIDELERREFMLLMVDRWTMEDREALRKVQAELRELKQ